MMKRLAKTYINVNIQRLYLCVYVCKNSEGFCPEQLFITILSKPTKDAPF